MSENRINLKNSLASLMKQAREDKIVSYEEINNMLSEKNFSTDKIDQLITKLQNDGVQLVDTIEDKQALLSVPEDLVDFETIESTDFDEVDSEDRKSVV